MKYPIDFKQIMKKARRSGIRPNRHITYLIHEIIELINDAYWQGRLDESLRGGSADE